MNIQRLTDPNSGGGLITTIPQDTVFANGLLVAVIGSSGTSHPPCGSPQGSAHCAGVWVTTGGSPTVFIGGLPVNRLGDSDTCTDIRISGSSDVFVG